MAQYLLSAHGVAGQTREPMSEERIAEVTRKVLALEAEMKETGAWVFGGRLHDPDTATVVRMQGGEVLATDGPFVEAREYLGGVYIVDVDDLDAAMRWAARTSELVDSPIEVRPFVDMPQA